MECGKLRVQKNTLAGVRDSAILQLLIFTGCRIFEPGQLLVKA